jgi:branched-chain amino acid transport system ATP-binding protein
MMLLDVDDIHAFYGKSQILHGISLEIDKGEIVALLGRNGVGKSTTLKSIMGLVPPKKGSVRFKGQEVGGLKAHTICRLGIGYVPEERRIFAELTVRENLLMGIKPNHRVDDSWPIDKIYGCFPRLGERDRQKGKHLSGGEQQMLTMGRTLMGNPEVLLLDEPTEGLAPALVDMVVQICRDVNGKGCSILLVEHSLDVALSLATRGYIMSKGEIVHHGTRDELESNEEVRKKYLEV